MVTMLWPAWSAVVMLFVAPLAYVAASLEDIAQRGVMSFAVVVLGASLFWNLRQWRTIRGLRRRDATG